MRFRSASTLTQADVGRLVTVRRTLDEGGTGDVIGVLESLMPAELVVRDRRGEVHTIPVARVVAARVISR